jgi:hypothetical protein
VQNAHVVERSRARPPATRPIGSVDSFAGYFERLKDFVADGPKNGEALVVYPGRRRCRSDESSSA